MAPQFQSVELQRVLGDFDLAATAYGFEPARIAAAHAVRAAEALRGLEDPVLALNLSLMFGKLFVDSASHAKDRL